MIPFSSRLPIALILSLKAGCKMMGLSWNAQLRMILMASWLLVLFLSSSCGESFFSVIMTPMVRGTSCSGCLSEMSFFIVEVLEDVFAALEESSHGFSHQCEAD